MNNSILDVWVIHDDYNIPHRFEELKLTNTQHDPIAEEGVCILTKTSWSLERNESYTR
jgi:hypothetical protein